MAEYSSKCIEYNNLVLERLSEFLCFSSDSISEEDVNDYVKACGCSYEEAVGIILAIRLDLFDNKEILDMYFKDMVKELDVNAYVNKRAFSFFYSFMILFE